MSVSPKKRLARALARQAASAGGEDVYHPLKVALIGRPNTGKSTLFNRLVEKKLAIVNPIPGTTRDWKHAEGRLGPLPLDVFDTGGLELTALGSMESDMLRLTSTALQHADVVMFMVDASDGITEADRHFAQWVHKHRRGPVLLVVNKAEKILSEPDEWTDDWMQMSAECFELGLGDPLPLSAEHGDGMAELCETLLTQAHTVTHKPFIPLTEEELEQRISQDMNIPTGALKLHQKVKAASQVCVAIAGRPNVGKSTLLNSLLEHDRVLTGPTPGVTRDAVEVNWQYGDRDIKLIDTAGMRRWGSWDLSSPLEAVSVEAAKRSLAMANVVALLVDATVGLTKQDLAIAQEVVSEGRALVVVLNKIDECKAPRQLHTMLDEALQSIAVDARGVKVVSMSALHGDRVADLMPAVLEVYDKWNFRASTGLLNQWLFKLCQVHPPPAALKTVVTRGAGRDKGRASKSLRLKLKYITQINIRPPTFALFCNRPDVPESYRRFLINSLRTEFELEGVPVRLVCRASANPYNKRASGGRADGRMADKSRSTRYGGTKSVHAKGPAPSSGMRNAIRKLQVKKRKQAAKDASAAAKAAMER